ncbi:MAG: hypothetical protein LUI85_04005 [Bacteroides sp.]|nr:hypothetical protein [Bacteroides sp.]
MPKVNFLSLEYRCESLKHDKILGICDPEGESPAYTTTDEGTDKWIATIQNMNQVDLLFIPVDKNILIYRPNGDKESTCDGMILYKNSIVFVELKDVRVGGWLSEAIQQLATTIDIFNQNHNSRDFEKRYAYPANCRHPQFQTSCRELLQEFRNKYHFTLLPKALVVIE